MDIEMIQFTGLLSIMLLLWWLLIMIFFLIISRNMKETEDQKKYLNTNEDGSKEVGKENI